MVIEDDPLVVVGVTKAVDLVVAAAVVAVEVAEDAVAAAEVVAETAAIFCAQPRAVISVSALR